MKTRYIIVTILKSIIVSMVLITIAFTALIMPIILAFVLAGSGIIGLVIIILYGIFLLCLTIYIIITYKRILRFLKDKLSYDTYIQRRK